MVSGRRLNHYVTILIFVLFSYVIFMTGSARAEAGDWQIATIDATGNVGEDTSIAVDSSKNVYISYYDVSNGDLKYATNASGSWINEIVDSAGNVGWHTSLAIDPNGKAHISYYDFTNGVLKYATNKTGSWITEYVDVYENGVGRFTSIALDSNNKAHISYYEYFGNLQDLKYATNASGSWVTTTIDSDGAVGLYTSIAIDPNNIIHIAYYHYSGYLKHATNAADLWTIETVDNIGDVGKWPSIALDSGNKIHISYYGSRPDSQYELFYATNTSGSWKTQTVDSPGDVGKYSSLAVDSNNMVHISYFDDTTDDLKYATNASGSWVTATVDSAGSVGLYTSIAVDSSNGIYISYHDDTTQALKFARKMPYQPVLFTITVTKSGAGTGAISATGLTCTGNACTGAYNSGTSVVLTAIADASSTFYGWSGGGCSGTGQCTVLMDASKNITAVFIKSPSDTCHAAFIGTGSTNVPRWWPTATLLQSGKVLITGGTGTTKSAEIYDPATSIFTTTGDMSTTLGGGHTATLLTNGKVLIAGGNINDPSTSSNIAQLYDPTNNTFIATGNMNVSRLSHTATLLPNGKVLITGGTRTYSGTTWFDPVNSAEIYDPATGIFTATGNMTVSRTTHIAELLPNGKVLIAGGSDYLSYLNSAEIYDPSTGAFTATSGNLAVRRAHGVASTLLADGKVLISGGINNEPAYPTYLAFAEIYDPNLNTFTSVGNMTESRRGHRMALLPDGKVLVTGGENGGVNPSALKSAEIYNPSTAQFTAIDNMSIARAFHAFISLLSGDILIAGGSTTEKPAEVYSLCPQSAESSISLSAGWNFISFPKDPSPNNTIAEVLKDVSSNVRVVWGYNNSTKEWLKYSGQGIPTTIETGKGYWIYMNAAGTIDMISWTAPSTTKITLYPGWNLVGYNGTSSVISLPAGYVIIWNWTNGVWYAKRADAPQTVTLTGVEQKKAYWIKMDSAQPVDWVQ